MSMLTLTAKADIATQILERQPEPMSDGARELLTAWAEDLRPAYPDLAAELTEAAA